MPPHDDTDTGIASISIDSYVSLGNRELAWLAFARRVLAMVEDPALPLLERVKFVGIMGVLHYEYFTKRASRLKRQIRKRPDKRSMDGRTPAEELAACTEEVNAQLEILYRVMQDEILPGLEQAGVGLVRWEDLSASQVDRLRRYFQESVRPVLIPLAVDAEHPFPFISNLGINLAVQVPDADAGRTRFVRIKVPVNRPRWVPVGERGFVPLEELIRANLAEMFPQSPPREVYCFRVTRAAEAEASVVERERRDSDIPEEPGGHVHYVSAVIKARRFAEVVRLQVERSMPLPMRRWLAEQLQVEPSDVLESPTLLGLSDFLRFKPEGMPELLFPPHRPRNHPRLVAADDIFAEIRRGDLLVHCPYTSFDKTVLRFLQDAAKDPRVLAIQLTIYRTSSDSPIVAALAEAARRGKQVAVLVEITARFDEAPNIAWGAYLESEGVHVAYGVEQLKTHVKLALVVREEQGVLRRYAHLGTGNYHSGTARIYEDLGILTSDPVLCEDAARVFAALTGATPLTGAREIMVAPVNLREGFAALIRREAEHARAGRACGIDAKLNQLQDRGIIRELYLASQAGVPITLNVRGLCTLRPRVPGLSDNIRVFGIIWRFLEHSRIYRFENGGEPLFFIGSADWMERNLDRRVESVVPVKDPDVRAQLEHILEVYRQDNVSAWDCSPDMTYARRHPGPGETPRAAQDVFAAEAAEQAQAAYEP